MSVIYKQRTQSDSTETTGQFYVRPGNSFAEETFMVNGFKALKHSLDFIARVYFVHTLKLY